MTQDHGENPHIRYVTQDLFGRQELWAVGTAQPRTGFGEPSYRALFAVAVASDEVASPITRCELGQTPLAAKRPIDRATAAGMHPELVRRAEAEWATLDNAGSPDNADGTGSDGAAVLDELARLDPALDIGYCRGRCAADRGGGRSMTRRLTLLRLVIVVVILVDALALGAYEVTLRSVPYFFGPWHVPQCQVVK